MITIRRAGFGFAFFAILATVLTLGIAMQTKGFPLGAAPGYLLTASFDDVTGLAEGDPVYLAGVQVGEVASLRLDVDVVAVEFSVDEAVQLPTDTTVSVRWRDLIGQRELRLTAGEASGSLGEGDSVASTRSATDVGALLNQIGPIVQAVDPAQVNQIIEAVAVALDGNHDSIASVVADADQVLAMIAARDGQVQELFADYARVTETIARRDTQIRQLIDDVSSMAEVFVQAEDVLDEALQEFPSMAASLERLLDARGNELGNTVDRFQQVLQTIAGRSDDVGALLEALPGGLEALFRATRHGDYVLLNIPCVANQAPPCPHPTPTQPPAPAGTRLDSRDAFEGLLLGGLL